MYYKAEKYQSEAIKFIITHKNAAVFLGCSLGKTSITLSALHLLKLNKCPEVDKGKVLIIAPPLAAAETWPSEIQKWDHLKDYNIGVLKGTAKKRIKMLENRTDYDFLSVSADLVAWITEYYGPKWPFETCIVDELSLFKSYSSKRVKALSAVRPYIKRVIGLTGTPAPKGHEDLWAEFKIIDNGAALFPKFGQFKKAYMEPYASIRCPNGKMRDLYRVKRQAEPEIVKKIVPVTLSMKTSDKLKMPDLVTVDHTCSLSDEDLDFQKTFIKQKLMMFKDSEDGKAIVPYTPEELENIIMSDRYEDLVTVKSAGVLANKLQQWASGTIYADDGSAIVCHDAKIDMLGNILVRLAGEPCLIAYWFKSDKKRIEEELVRQGIEPHEILTPDDIQNWNSGKYEACLVHPARCGHGLNLQSGGHNIIWFTPCWSLELYQQMTDRLYRKGQTSDTVVVHRIVAGETIDERIITRLASRDMKQQELFNATGSIEAEDIKNVVLHFVRDTVGVSTPDSL